MVKKIITGYVVQYFNKKGTCCAQEFVASNEEVEHIDEATNKPVADPGFYAPVVLQSTYKTVRVI